MGTEYHKIETLYERGDNFKVQPWKFKSPVYSTINPWRWTEKVDGTNIRVGRINETYFVGGKTENANLPADLLNNIAGLGLDEKLSTVFQSDVVLYGEGYGAGIQKGGSYRADKSFILFDVLVDGKWWLDYENVKDVGTKLGLDVVPDFGIMTLADATDYVRNGFDSVLAQTPNTKAEGLVGRPIETLFDKKGSRIIVKLKTKDF